MMKIISIIIISYLIILTSHASTIDKFKIIGIKDSDIYLGVINYRQSINNEWESLALDDILITYENAIIPCNGVKNCDEFEDKISNFLSMMTKDEVIRYLNFTKDAWTECDNKYNGKCKYIGRDFWIGDDAYLYRIAIESHEDNNLKRAIIFARIGAENGYSRAQNFMGSMYDPTYEEHSHEKNYSKAASWYQKAVEQDLPSALYNLGVLYRYGNGVKKSNKKSFTLFKRSAEHGYVRAQYMLGEAYENGNGTTLNYKMALKWYEKAGNNGSILAMYNAGVFYNKGRGVNVDYCKAVKWYTKAANAGLADAQYNLANRYMQGQCVKKNAKKALRLYKKAAVQDHKLSIKALQNIRKQD